MFDSQVMRKLVTFDAIYHQQITHMMMMIELPGLDYRVHTYN